MFGAGAFLAYSDKVLEKYSEYTETSYSQPLSPIKLDYQLRTLPLYQFLSRESHSWVRLRSWENLDRNILDKTEVKVREQTEYKAPSLTNQTLAQAGGIQVKPVIFHNTVTDETITIVHMGYRLCGFPFIVHGGMIATLLNETMKRNASLADFTRSTLKDDFKVEHLSIDYKRPLFANNFFVVKTNMQDYDKISDSVTIKSTMESETGTILVEGTARLRNTGRASRMALEARASKWSLF